jgi:hypothetical protein
MMEEVLFINVWISFIKETNKTHYTVVKFINQMKIFEIDKNVYNNTTRT